MKQGWEIKKLDDICTIKGRIGYRGYTKQDIVEEGKGAISLSPSNIQENQINYKNCTYISWFKYDESPEIKVYEGDIIYCKTASIGKIALIENLPEKATINPQFVVLKNIKCSSKYLFFFMNSKVFKEQEFGIIGGTAIPTLSQANLGNLKIPLPPLPEQQRIVSILDKVFSVIERSRNNAEQNLKNAKELFESYLQGVFENGNWETKTVQEVAKVINGYAFASKDFKPTNTIKSIKITNVGVKEFVEDADNYLPEKFKNTLKEVQVREGNIVIALTRTIISAGLKVAVVPASYNGALVNQRVAALVPRENLVNQNFLYFYLTTSGVAKYVLEHVNTLMQPNLSINDLKNMPISCPSLKEQQTIVRQLDALRAETQKLEAVYGQKIADLEELKKSILQKAISGELQIEKAIAV